MFKHVDSDALRAQGIAPICIAKAVTDTEDRKMRRLLSTKYHVYTW